MLTILQYKESRVIWSTVPAKPFMSAAILKSFSPLNTGREARGDANQSCFRCQSMHLMSSCVLKKMKNTGVKATRQGKAYSLSKWVKTGDAAIIGDAKSRDKYLVSKHPDTCDSNPQFPKNTQKFSTDSHTCRTLIKQVKDEGHMNSLHLSNIYLNPVVAGRRTDYTDTRFKTFTLNLKTIIHTVQDFAKQCLRSSFAAVGSEHVVKHYKQHKCGKMPNHRRWISQADVGEGRHVSNAFCNVMSDLIVRKLRAFMISICTNFIFQTLLERCLVFSRVNARVIAFGQAYINATHGSSLSCSVFDPNGAV